MQLALWSKAKKKKTKSARPQTGKLVGPETGPVPVYMIIFYQLQFSIILNRDVLMVFFMITNGF